MQTARARFVTTRQNTRSARGLVTLVACAAMTLTLLACETRMGLARGLASKAMEGASISVKEFSGMIASKTMIDVNGNYAMFYPEDGTKLIDSGGLRLERKWQMDDNGLLCETLFADNEEECFAKNKPKIIGVEGVFTLVI